MGNFKNLSKTQATSRCLKCQRMVNVNSQPMPNDIDLSGSALAMECNDR